MKKKACFERYGRHVLSKKEAFFRGREILGAEGQGSKSLARRGGQQNKKMSTRRASAGKIFLANGIFRKMYEQALKPVLLSRNNAWNPLKVTHFIP